MAFEPLPGAKDTTSCVIMEASGEELSKAARNWLANVGNAYQVSVCDLLYRVS
jgi:hypothetical protein